MVVEDQT
jgi:hypothetical protein